MPHAVSIRPARLEDLDSLLALYRQLAEDEDPGQDRSHAPDVLAEAIAQPRRHLMVAELDGRVIGTADLLVVGNLTHAAQPWAIIENVVVEQAHRRDGVGAALMRNLIDRARDAGCYRVLLTSDKGRGDAHRFYRRLGFEAVAEGFKIYFEE